jgi:protease-4
MRSFVLAVWFCAAMAGCHCMPTVNVNATAHVKPELPVNNPGPVVAQTVAADHGADCDCEDCCSCTPKVAVIDVDGLIVNSDMTGLGSAGENPVAIFRERLDAAANDPCVRAVVLRINSPGGGVTATDIMWHDLRRFREQTRLPVVACIMDVGTGGAYYLSTASDYIVAHPTSVTGGIGVILNLYDFSLLMEHYQILSTPVKAGKNIDLGTPLRAMSDEKRELLQKMADEYHTMFKRVIEDARPGVDASNDTNFDGRVFCSSEAIERRLIDEVGYLDDAVEMAKRLGGISSAKVVLFHRCSDRARTPYAITPNVPLQNTLFPISIPALDRSKMPTFLYLWQPEPTMEKMVGR